MSVASSGGFRKQELTGQRWRAAIANALTEQAHALNELHARTTSHQTELGEIQKGMKTESLRLDCAFELRNRSFWGRMTWLVRGR